MKEIKEICEETIKRSKLDKIKQVKEINTDEYFMTFGEDCILLGTKHKIYTFIGACEDEQRKENLVFGFLKDVVVAIYEPEYEYPTLQQNLRSSEIAYIEMLRIN